VTKSKKGDEDLESGKHELKCEKSLSSNNHASKLYRDHVVYLI